MVVYGKGYGWFSILKNVTMCHTYCKHTVCNKLKLCDEELKVCKLERILEIEIDDSLFFRKPIKTLYSKAAKKVNTLPRIPYFIEYSKINLLFLSAIKL